MVHFAHFHIHVNEDLHIPRKLRLVNLNLFLRNHDLTFVQKAYIEAFSHCILPYIQADRVHMVVLCHKALQNGHIIIHHTGHGPRSRRNRSRHCLVPNSEGPQGKQQAHCRYQDYHLDCFAFI